MLKHIILIALFLLSFISFGQGLLSGQDLSGLKVDELSETEISQIRSEILKRNLTITEVQSLAVAKGMSPLEFSILEQRLQLSPQEVSGEKSVTKELSDVAINNVNAEATERENNGWIFGSEIFNTKSLSFEPNQSLPTPSNYIVGPGDEFQIAIFGVQQFAQNARVNKEGKIILANIGTIHVAGLQFGAVQEVIKSRASVIYNTLRTSESELSIAISDFKSIQVTLIGVERPGNYTLSSLSTVFNALHVAGGPAKNGSYRNIELIRSGKVIKQVDLYDFLTKGDLSSNLNLQSDDIIRVPIYNRRVEVIGKVKRPGLFELAENESWKELLQYCFGFSEDAYKKSVKLTSISATERRIETLSLAELDTFKFNSGDIVKIDGISNRFENRVRIQGAVFKPGDFELIDGMTLNQLLDEADGLKEDAFLDRALLIRETETLEKKIIGLNLRDNNSLSTALQKEDQVIISSLFDLQEKQTVNISGEVLNGGSFPFIKNLTLYDLIVQAGGFKESASRNVEIARLIISDSLNSDGKKSELLTFEIDKDFKSVAENIELKPFDVVSIRKIAQYELSGSVIIAGEIVYPGKYVLSQNNEKIGDLIARSGGLTPMANPKSVKILRRFDVQGTLGNENKTLIIPIDYDKILKNPNSKANINAREGDQIIIDKLIQTTGVSGSVARQSEIPIKGSKRAKYYINSSGGFKENAHKSKTYVVYANGIAKKTRNFGLFRVYPKPENGSTIFVPEKPEKDRGMSTQEVVALSGVLSSITGITIAIISLLQP